MKEKQQQVKPVNFFKQLFFSKEAKFRWLVFLGIFVGVFAIHFGLYIANRHGQFNYHSSAWIGIDTLYNPGTAYGLIKHPALVFALEGLLSLILLLIFLIAKQRLIYIPLAMMFTGGFANFVNRAINPSQGVFDYLRVNLRFFLFNFTANLPDLVIFFGATWLVISLLTLSILEAKKNDKKVPKEKPQQPSPKQKRK